MGLASIRLVRQFMGSTLEVLNVNYLFPDRGPGKCQTDAILDFEQEEMLPFYLMSGFESIKCWQHRQERGDPDIYLFFLLFLVLLFFFNPCRDVVVLKLHYSITHIYLQVVHFVLYVGLLQVTSQHSLRMRALPL